MATDNRSAIAPHQDLDQWDELVESVGPSAILVLISSWMGGRLEQWCTSEDLWQETLIMAWRDRQQHQWHGVRAYRSWLLGIARNRIRDAAGQAMAKKRGGTAGTLPFSSLTDDRSESLAALLPARSTTPSRVAAHSERARLMMEVLAALPAKDSEVVRLRLFEELPMQTVADQIGVSLSTAKRRLYFGAERYRSELRARLGSRSSAP